MNRIKFEIPFTFDHRTPPKKKKKFDCKRIVLHREERKI